MKTLTLLIALLFLPIGIGAQEYDTTKAECGECSKNGDGNWVWVGQDMGAINWDYDDCEKLPINCHWECLDLNDDGYHDLYRICRRDEPESTGDWQDQFTEAEIHLIIKEATKFYEVYPDTITVCDTVWTYSGCNMCGEGDLEQLRYTVTITCRDRVVWREK